MKIFMWTAGVLTDWSSGMGFALAETEEEARHLLQEGVGEDYAHDFDGPPDEVREIDQPSVYFVRGGS